MSVLRTTCMRRADKENDPSISSAEWNALISEMWGELYSIIADSGMEYFETSSTISTTGAASYNEPSDHLGTVGVDYLVNATSGKRQQLQPITASDRAKWTGITGTATRYILIDDQLFLYPKPPTGQTYYIRYIPQPPDLTAYADADLVDVVSPDGLSFVAWGTAVKALSKSELDTTLAIQEREAARGRVSEWAQLRDFGGPRGQTVIVDSDDPMWTDSADWRYR